VDALARHYRVVISHHAGIGQTQALPAPFTIDAVADQTSALIRTLGLHQPDILGWSMGGMIAQALAVRHPGQVRRLVLCASFPGTGPVVEPSQTAVRALTSGNPQEARAALYPANQAKAYDAFVAAISRYPSPLRLSGHSRSPDPRGQGVAEWRRPSGPAAHHDLPAQAHRRLYYRPDRPGGQRSCARQADTQSRAHALPRCRDAFLFQKETTFTVLVQSFLSGHSSH
jgi:pimeloyl-ACP methyl ester carboxylesterase